MHATLQSRQSSDRRKYPRTPVLGAVDLRASGIEIPLTANLRDISPGGCAIESRVALGLKQALRIKFPLPGAAPMVIDGNIVRSIATAADKMYHYGIRFRVETASLRDNLVTYINSYCHKARKHTGPDRRNRGAVDARFSVTVSAHDVRPFNAMAISLSTEGIRLASDRILRQEWSMKLELKLPGTMLAAPPLLVNGHAKPGAKSVRGSYVQDVVFVEPSLHALTEIERAMTEAGHKARRAS
jgi:hypothetical protein